MILATVSSVLGVILFFGSMLQQISLSVRYGSITAMIICEAVFVWSFLSLGTES
jgi:hypothetical protein